MADYVMLEDIFETTENMTVLRDNRLMMMVQIR